MLINFKGICKKGKLIDKCGVCGGKGESCDEYNMVFSDNIQTDEHHYHMNGSFHLQNI